MSIVISPAKTSGLNPVTIFNNTNASIVATPQTALYQPAGSHCVAGGASPVQLSINHAVTVPAHGKATVVPSGNVPAGDYLVGWHVGGNVGKKTSSVSYILDSQQVVGNGGSSAKCAVSHRVARTVAPHHAASAAPAGSSIPVTGLVIAVLAVLVVALAGRIIFGGRRKGTHAA